MVPIRCNEGQIQLASSMFPCQVVDFPLTYLGIPLSIAKILNTTLHPLVDKMADRLPSWKGRLMHMSGCMTLLKMTLATMQVHSAIILELPPWLHKAFKKIMKAFLCTGTDEVQGGKWLVAWSWVQHPLQLGGLSVPDFILLGRALRSRWLWLSKTDPARSWSNLTCKDSTSKSFFLASKSCILGDGNSTLFSTDPWLEGCCIGSILLELLDAVLTRKRA
jgi:hypothetical protein